MPSESEYSTSSEVEQLQFKVSLLGDVSVGKSALAQRFCKDFFADTYRQTLGVDFFSRTVQLPGNREATFNLFDIGGSQCGSKMLKTYISGSDAFLYVFDITSADSFNSLEQWHTVAADTCPNAISVLVANKSDLSGKREVSQDMMSQMKPKIGAQLDFLASARTGDRVQMLFIQLAGLLLNEDLHAMSLDQQQSARVNAPSDSTQAIQRLNKNQNAIGSSLAKEIRKAANQDKRVVPQNTANRGKVLANDLNASASQASGLFASSKSAAKTPKKKGFCSGQ